MEKIKERHKEEQHETTAKQDKFKSTQDLGRETLEVQKDTSYINDTEDGITKIARKLRELINDRGAKDE